MRAVLGILLLVLLFVAAGLVQENWIQDARDRLPGLSRPARVEAASEVARRRAEEGWARLVVGHPSGVEPLVLEPRPGEVPAPLPDEPAPVRPEDVPPARPADYEVTLDASSTLSEICQRFYGSAAPRLYRRLAEYNGLSDPNAIRAGQRIQVPPTRELLMEER